MCDINPLNIWHHVKSIGHHTHSLWHHKNVFMTSHPLYSWHHTHCIWHHIHYTCDITATVSMTRHYVYDTILSICDIWHGVWVTTQPLVWHHTHSICLITHTWLMIPQTMSVWNHTHCMYDIIGMVYDITPTLQGIIPFLVCHGTHYVHDIISTVYDVTHALCMATQTLYLTWDPFYLPSYPLYISSHSVKDITPTM